MEAAAVEERKYFVKLVRILGETCVENKNKLGRNNLDFFQQFISVLNYTVISKWIRDIA